MLNTAVARQIPVITSWRASSLFRHYRRDRVGALLYAAWDAARTDDPRARCTLAAVQFDRVVWLSWLVSHI